MAFWLITRIICIFDGSVVKMLVIVCNAVEHSRMTILLSVIDIWVSC